MIAWTAVWISSVVISILRRITAVLSPPISPLTIVVDSHHFFCPVIVLIKSPGLFFLRLRNRRLNFIVGQLADSPPGGRVERNVETVNLHLS